MRHAWRHSENPKLTEKTDFDKKTSMTTFKYFDYNSNIILEENLLSNEGYYKVHLNDNDEIKIVECIENNKTDYIDYYLEKTESIDDIFKQFPNFDYITFYTNKEKKSKYSKYDVLVIDKSKMVQNRRIQVYSNLLLPIYDRALDLNTNETIFFEKRFNIPEKCITYEFEYEAKTGNFSRLTIYDPLMYVDTSNNTIYPIDIGIGKNDYNFDWEGFEYYKNAEPILPEG